MREGRKGEGNKQLHGTELPAGVKPGQLVKPRVPLLNCACKLGFRSPCTCIYGHTAAAKSFSKQNIKKSC